MDFNWFICSYQLFSYEQKREINSGLSNWLPFKKLNNPPPTSGTTRQETEKVILLFLPGIREKGYVAHYSERI